MVLGSSPVGVTIKTLWNEFLCHTKKEDNDFSIYKKQTRVTTVKETSKPKNHRAVKIQQNYGVPFG